MHEKVQGGAKSGRDGTVRGRTHCSTLQRYLLSQLVISCGRTGWYIALCGVAPITSTPIRPSVWPGGEEARDGVSVVEAGAVQGAGSAGHGATGKGGLLGVWSEGRHLQQNLLERRLPPPVRRQDNLGSGGVLRRHKP